MEVVYDRVLRQVGRVSLVGSLELTALFNSAHNGFADGSITGIERLM